MLATRHSYLNPFLSAFVVLIALTGMTPNAPAQTITQIIDFAGDGVGNVLNAPARIAVDASGNIYVTGILSDNAFKISPSGLITEIIHAVGDGAGSILDRPQGIAVDAEGNVYVTGETSDNAFKITPGGLITAIIDATGDGVGNILDRTEGIAVDADGNVYVTGESSNNAFKITPGGLITEIINSSGDGAGNMLNGPFGIAVDADGNVYVNGLASDNAFKITPSGVVTEIIDSNGDGAANVLDGTGGITVEGDGNVYVTGRDSDNAFKISPGGLITEIIDSIGDGAGNVLDQPHGIAVDAGGNIYVTGALSNNVFKITPDGVITKIIDASGDGAGNILDRPFFIAVDTAGNVYVAGQVSDNAFKVSFGACGDGVIDTREECDDFNTASGDGCSAICTVEEGFACVSEPSVCGPDCNVNGVPDAQDIAGGASPDCNGNGIPDECDLGIAPPEFILETAPQGSSNGGTSISSCQFLGARFSFDRPHRITNIGGHVKGASTADRNILVAIVPVSGTEGFPSDPSLSEAIFTSVVDAPFNDVGPFPFQVADTVINTDFLLDPGTYAIVFGSGLFGATGSAWMPVSGPIQELPWFFTWNCEAFRNLDEQPIRFLVKGMPAVSTDCNENGVPDQCDITDGNSEDCNANDIPDDCDTDSDGDGVIDDCDPCPLDDPDDTDGDGVCDVDDLCADTPLGLLVELNGCTAAEGPCCFPGPVCIGETDRQTCESFPDGVFQGEGLTCGDPDGDGIVGCDDGCPLDPEKADPGVCGCGVPDDDEDSDGIADCNDRCLRTLSGLPVNDCGCPELGACCAANGACVDDIERTVCVIIAGIYQGDGSTCADDCTFGDQDGDDDVDLGDVGAFLRCFTGEGGEVTTACMAFDVDGCGSIDLDDLAALMDALTGPTGNGGDPVCGNGVLEPGEECDDGNVEPGDGCDENCETEAGFCGDGILALPDEECDDGNTVPGDGCDENCLVERPANDDCVDAITVFDGDTEFNNILATTDGPNEPATCGFEFGTTQVDADVWYCYEATCNGTVTASLCGSEYDTKLAVYDGCTCPPTERPLGCSDDDCGNVEDVRLHSRVTFDGTAGQNYLIRVGGFDVGTQGEGTLAIRCDAQPLCNTALGDCFATDGNGSPGCDVPSCCELTCARDPICCDVHWSSTCAVEAQLLCEGSIDACSTSTEDCHDGNNSGPGCGDESCCTLVCEVDPFCCADTWDDVCVEEAAGICGLNCGTSGGLGRNNACDVVADSRRHNPVAGCADETTCKDVCTAFSECCQEEWSQKCVCLADPSEPCCASVCAIDPYCCETDWDDLCDQEVNDLCGP